MIENNDTDEGGQTKHHPTSGKRPITNAKTRQQQQQQQQHKEQTRSVSGTNGVVVEETTRSKIGGNNNNNNNNNRCITCFRLLRDWRGNQLAKYYETKSNLTDLLDNKSSSSSRNLVVTENDASSRVLELIKTYLISSSSANSNANNTRYVRNLLSNLNSISCSPKVCHSCFDCLNQIDNHMQHVQTLCSSMRARLDKSCRLIKNGQSNASRSKRLISRRKRRVAKKNTATVSLYNKLPRNMSDLNGWSYQNSALSSSLVYLPKHINRKLTVCVDTDRSDLENGSMTSSLISPPLRKYAMIDANDFELQRDQSKTSKSSEDNCLDHSSDKNFLSPNSSTNRRKRKSGNPSRFSHTLLHADVNNSAHIHHQSKENTLQQQQQLTNKQGSESIISPAEYASYSTKTTTNNNTVNNKVMNLRYRNANNATQAVHQQQQRTTNGKVVTKKLLTNNTLNADNNNNDYDEQQLLMQNRINMMKRNLDQINSNKSRLVVASKDRHELDLDAVHTNHRSNKENDNSSENFEVYHINNGNDEMDEEENGNGTEYDDDGNMMYLKVKDDNEHHHNHHNHHNHNHSSGEIDEEAVEAASEFEEEDEESKFCEIDDDLAAGFEYENDENLEEQETEEQSFDIMQDGGVGGIYEEEDEDVDEYDEEEDDDEDNDETFQIKGSAAKGHAPPKLTKHLNHLTDVEKRKGVNSRSKGDLLSGDGLIKNFISSALTNAVQSGGKHSSGHGGDTLYTKHTCNICKKSFKTQNILRQHMRIHTGDKPFVCEICQKAFSQMASLKYHLATHSDDRPFKCEDCSKTFKLKPPFKKHIKECPQRLIKLEKAEPSGSSSSINSKKPSAVVSSSSSISSSSPLYFKTGIK